MRLVCLSLLLALVLLLSCTEDEATKPDVTPPGTVADLIVLDEADGMVLLTWTAPGDDGGSGRAARYDIRYAATLASEADWSSATALVDSTRVPKAAGDAESLAVGWLDDGDWQFALKAADEVSNWSAISNVAAATLIDSMAPGQVTDLAANLVTAETVRLTWTAPGDDGEWGRAASYDLRYASATITEETWGAAIPVEGLPAPKAPGSVESFIVTGLEQATGYNFALKAIDNAGNEAGLSNVLGKSTARLERLTTRPSFFLYGAGQADWSPDGQRIAFAADWDYQQFFTEIYMMSASGADIQRLTAEAYDAHSPSWSPDGTRLAFICPRNVNHDSILIMDAVPGAAAETVFTETTATTELGGAKWSPDGSRIAFYLTEWPAIPPLTVIRCDLYTVDLLGRSLQHILVETREIMGLDWSPDGSQIVYASGLGGLWVVSASGGTPVRLTPDSGIDLAPAWSPDGSRIAFASTRTGDLEIWLMTSAAEDPVQVTFGSPGGASGPAWSPDGRAVAFQVYENDGCNIWALRWD